jgi:hypothetical protein
MPSLLPPTAKPRCGVFLGYILILGVRRVPSASVPGAHFFAADRCALHARLNALNAFR